MPRLTKIYTRGGDDGTTALGGGQRVPKDSLRVQVYGTVDELNSQIGVALAGGLCARLQGTLCEIQNELFHLGSDLCFREEDKERYTIPQIEQRHVDRLEELIDELTPVVGVLENFILPGGSLGAAQLHVARTVCRRAEREAASLLSEEAINPLALRYLNRLSDALFVMARFENYQQGVPEPLWDPAA
jgi:cob(I)alamin adenosyltransferase